MLSSLSDSKPINFFVVQPSYLEFFLFSCPLSPTYNPYYKLDSFLQQTPEKQELRQNIGKHHRGVKTLSSTYDGVDDGVFYQKTPSWALARVRNGLRIISLILQACYDISLMDRSNKQRCKLWPFHCSYYIFPRLTLAGKYVIPVIATTVSTVSFLFFPLFFIAEKIKLNVASLIRKEPSVFS